MLWWTERLRQTSINHPADSDALVVVEFDVVKKQEKTTTTTTGISLKGAGARIRRSRELSLLLVWINTMLEQFQTWAFEE
jgi:hypothetical protein